MLEFNPPVHGTWNIVHIGMQVPKSHQIYVCAVNCMRGVIMTALEMGAGDRFSCVTLTEKDFYQDNLETITIEGVSQVLEELEILPPQVLLFTVCIHKFVGCDLDYVYRTLEERFPTVTFARCYMDPISQKEGPSPDQKLRVAMFDAIEEKPVEPGKIALLGCDIPLEKESDLHAIAKSLGQKIVQLSECETYQDYLALGSAEKFFCLYPNGIAGVEKLAGRLLRPFLSLPVVWEMDKIEEAESAFLQFLGIENGSGQAQKKMREKAELKLEALAETLRDTPIVIDYIAVTRPVSLAALLFSFGFHVSAICMDECLPEEEELLALLMVEHPELLVVPTIDPVMRNEEIRKTFRRQVTQEQDAKVVAIGPKAAWLFETEHFVNMIENGGLFGFCGIIELADRIESAFHTAQDMHDIVPRKGLGCTCVIE